MVFGSLFRNNTKNRYYSNKNLSKTEQVKLLERRRQKKGYKKHWLYFRCMEENLLREYYKLFPDRHSIKQMNEDFGYTEFIRFSFGKYHGETIDAIWEKDKQYITWLSNQDWLSEYQEEYHYIMGLVYPDDLDT